MTVPAAAATVTRGNLVDTVLPRSFVVSAAAVTVGAAITGALAQLAIPLWPVPITGQTLAVVVVSAALGLRKAIASMALYIGLGLVGVPWYSDAHAGWSVLAGPTGGYLVGFLLAAAIIGAASDRGLRRFSLRAFLVYAAGSAAVFVPGVAWLAVSLHLDAGAALGAGLLPFIPGGIVKAVLATAALPAMWRLAERLPRRS